MKNNIESLLANAANLTLNRHVWQPIQFAFVLVVCLGYIIGSHSIFADELLRSKHVLAEGTDFETPFHVIESNVEGPCLFVIGGMHGNEPAGSAAASQIRNWPISRGRMVVIPKANLAGLLEKTRYQPNVERAARDLNRNFPIEIGSTKPRGRLAESIWKLVLEQEPDFVIDLHEGYEFNISHQPTEGKKKSVGSSLIFRGTQPGIQELADKILGDINGTISNPERKFTRLSRGPVAGSLTRACIETLDIPALIVETTFKDQPLSTRCRQHRLAVNRILLQLGMLNSNAVNRLTLNDPNRINVAIFDGPGTSVRAKANLVRCFSSPQLSSEIEYQFIGPADANDSVLENFDCLIFPGGSASRQANALGTEGRECIKRFVENGGGYVGICAGAYLCSAHYSWSLKIINMAVLTGPIEGEKRQLWFRGPATRLAIDFSELGQTRIPDCPNSTEMSYQNGPIISPGNDLELPKYDVLASYESETWIHESQRGTQIHSPAIVSAAFGNGRVVAISPHPEADAEFDSIVLNLIEWAAKPTMVDSH